MGIYIYNIYIYIIKLHISGQIITKSLFPLTGVMVNMEIIPSMAWELIYPEIMGFVQKFGTQRHNPT